MKWLTVNALYILPFVQFSKTTTKREFADGP